MIFLKILFEGASLFLLVPVLVLFAEVLLAVTSRSYSAPQFGERRRIAVLVPAHNESSVISGTLRSITPQLAPTDRLVVVADNCEDETAAIARAEGAEVILRTNSALRGKGYALDFGVRHVEHNPPEVLIVIDADCRIAPSAIDVLARSCNLTGRPTQALYLMRAQKEAGLNMRIAEFAWIVKNYVRPEGLRRLGLPCQLMGTGMAFPWTLIKRMPLATSHIVEDLKLGIDLTRSGAPPIFCPSALVTSEFPVSGDGVRGQRRRWEHGHLQVIVSEAPRLLLNSISQLNLSLLALTLDLCVPPLALLALLVVAALSASSVFYIVTNAKVPLGITTAATVLLFVSIMLSWLRYGRQTITIGSLALAMVYAFWKIPLYLRFFVARQMSWNRSKRNE